MNCQNQHFQIRPIMFEKNNLSPELIIMHCAKHYNVTYEDIVSLKRSRTNGVVPARHMSAYIMRTVLFMSQNSIAREVNRKDHTTIMNSVKRIQEYLERYEDIKRDREKIYQSLNIKL